MRSWSSKHEKRSLSSGAGFDCPYSRIMIVIKFYLFYFKQVLGLIGNFCCLKYVKWSNGVEGKKDGYLLLCS